MGSEEKSKDLILAPSDMAERESGDIDALTRTSDFLPQLRVYGSESTIVKKELFPIGHLGLYFTSEKILDLGTQVDCLIVDWRPRACLVAGDTPISFFGKFNTDGEEGEKWEYSKEFIDFKEKAMGKVKGYLVGLEYLIWFPTVSQFGLFLMGNPTLRRESPNVKALTRKACTLKIKFIEPKGSSYSWHGCIAFPCSTPFDLPDEGALKEAGEKFRNPKDSEVELVDDGKATGRAR